MKLRIFASIICLCISFAAQALNNKDLTHKVIKIRSQPSSCIYGEAVEKSGLGCIIDKKQGLILVTRDLANHLSMCKYEVTFDNGTKVDATLKYFDPWLDWAILQLDPSSIPQEYKEATFANRPLLNNENLHIASLQSDTISVVEGNVIDKHSIHGDFLPQGCYRIKLKNNGYFYSAPVFNEKGDLVSIVVKDEQGTALFLDPQYVTELVSSKKF